MLTLPGTPYHKRYSLLKRKLQKVLFTTKKNTEGQQFLTQCLHLGPRLIFDTIIVAGCQNSRNSRQKLFLQSTSSSTPLDLDTMMLRLLELTQMQKLSQDNSGCTIHASPRAWLAGSEQPRRLQNKKYSPFLVNLFFFSK